MKIDGRWSGVYRRISCEKKKNMKNLVNGKSFGVGPKSKARARVRVTLQLLLSNKNFILRLNKPTSDCVGLFTPPTRVEYCIILFFDFYITFAFWLHSEPSFFSGSYRHATYTYTRIEKKNEKSSEGRVTFSSQKIHFHSHPRFC